MRLAKLTATGFKSFADKTVISFDAPITGIVGPNGCGKSNVVDAIRWVLGTQSAKSLRGDAMMDVIFNGAATRKPSGMASVTLTFDNRDRALALGQDQVAVTRQLFRDGTSEYYVNKQRVRLRDIKELFMDTGVGTDAYAIIEQGKVARMLETNPAERREIFEEAAGIAKFKARKKEAQRKLERVEQNLGLSRTRLEDLARRVRAVRSQAGRARSWRDLTARLRELQLTYALAEHHKLSSRLGTLTEDLAQNQADRDRLAAEVAAGDQAAGDAQARRQEVAEQQQHLEQERLRHRHRRDQAEQRQAHCQRTRDEMAQQLARDGKHAGELAEREAQLESEGRDAGARLADLRLAQAAAAARLEAADLEHRGLQQLVHEAGAVLEEEKAGVIGMMRRSAQLHNEAGAHEAHARNLAANRERLAKRGEEVAAELGRLLARRDESRARLDQAASLLAAETARLEETRQQSAQLDAGQRELAARIGAAKERRASLESRRHLLQEMQDRQEGVADPVKAVLARGAAARRAAPSAATAPRVLSANGAAPAADPFPMVRGLLADLFETPVEHASLLESALGGFQQSLVIDSIEQLSATVEGAAAIQALAGRVHFVAVDRFRLPPGIDARKPAGLTSVVELATFPDWLAPLAWGLLGRTLVAETLEEARRLRAELPFGHRFVTRAGELIDTDGRVTAGPPATAAHGGLISRRSELHQLREQITRLDTAIAADQDALAQVGDRARHAARLAGELRKSIQDAGTVRAESASRIEGLAHQIERLEREQPVLAAEAEQVHRQAAEARELQAGKSAAAALADAGAKEREARVRDLSTRLAALKASAEAARDHLTAARVEATKTCEQIAGLERHLRQLDLARQDVQRQRQHLTERAAGHRVRVAELEATIEQSRQEGLGAQSTLDQVEAALADVAVLLAAADARRAELKSALAGLRARLETADALLRRLEVEQRELQVKLEGVAVRAKDQLGLDVAAAYAQAIGPATATGVGAPTTAGVDGWEDVGDVTHGANGSGNGNGHPATTPAPASPGSAAAPPTATFDPGSFDWIGVESEMRSVREKVERLGNVNLEAIDELASVEKQHTDMEAQVRDIEQARLDLDKLIAQINDDSRSRFEKTFAQVRENFASTNGLFRKLFGGGSADIVLQPDENGHMDILEAGIDIVAKPPGKEPQSITLLSGGEKTMTAVALLLSIFQTKPSPFAILDEVDAALDEANVGRFANILKSFLDRSHFIVITHNKGTMQVCDMLYGITMQERGVSKRVSVRFDQIGAGGEISRDAIDAQARHDAEARPEAEDQGAADAAAVAGAFPNGVDHAEALVGAHASAGAEPGAGPRSGEVGVVVEALDAGGASEELVRRVVRDVGGPAQGGYSALPLPPSPLDAGNTEAEAAVEDRSVAAPRSRAGARARLAAMLQGRAAPQAVEVDAAKA